MRNSLRTFVVALMVLAMTLNPAAACRFFHGAWGGYGDGCGSCCGCETVVYEDCGGCDSCDGVVIQDSEALHEPAPALPLEPQQPATVDRPIETRPAPVVPTQPAPELEPVPPADDLFNGTEETAPPTETPVEEPEDLFGAPPAESATPAETPPAEAPENDLFGPTEGVESFPAETEEAPAETPAEETPADETDDIFGSSRGVLRERGGLASQEMRMWVDNTGNYSCRGRLVRFLDGQVRLLKENGRTTTVALYRLSTDDLEFVNRQANAQKAEAFQTVQSLRTMPGFAN